MVSAIPVVTVSITSSRVVLIWNQWFRENFADRTVELWLIGLAECAIGVRLA